jgi:ribosomal protein L37AE/L43A
MYHLAKRTGEGKVNTKVAQCNQTSRSGRFCTTIDIYKKDKFKEVSVRYDNKHTCKKCLKIAIEQGRF